MTDDSQAVHDDSISKIRELESELKNTKRVLFELAHRAQLGFLFFEFIHDSTHRITNLAMDLTILRDSRAFHDKTSSMVIDHMSSNIEILRELFSKYRRLLRKKDKTEVINLKEVLKWIVESYKLAFHHSKIAVALKIQNNAPSIIFSSADLITVLMNLISNAGRSLYVSKGIKRKLQITVESDKEENVVIEVSDNGVGIRPEDFPKIFDPFFSTSDSFGLGLSICKQILNEYGATISCKSSWGHGASFFIHIPYTVKRG